MTEDKKRSVNIWPIILIVVVAVMGILLMRKCTPVMDTTAIQRETDSLRRVIDSISKAHEIDTTKLVMQRDVARRVTDSFFADNERIRAKATESQRTAKALRDERDSLKKRNAESAALAANCDQLSEFTRVLDQNLTWSNNTIDSLRIATMKERKSADSLADARAGYLAKMRALNRRLLDRQDSTTALLKHETKRANTNDKLLRGSLVANLVQLGLNVALIFTHK